MAEDINQIIRRYLEDAVAAESSFETQLRAFSREGDDSDVQTAFALHADETKQQYDRLARRLEELGGAPSGAKSVLAHIFGFAPKSVQVTHTVDEKTAQNLMIAYSIESGECALYEALAAVAQAAGDAKTEALAREIQAEEKQAAEKLWHFIPSRAKIAFNVLTAGETDPAVETRAADNRLFS